MNEYRGNLAVGVRPKPKLRMSNYRGLMSRHDDLMKNFNRRQRETINRVEYVFEKSNRQIETALIGMSFFGNNRYPEITERHRARYRHYFFIYKDAVRGI